MSRSIIVCGIGGQGTVLTAKVLSRAFLETGHRVLAAETAATVRRGSTVRTGETPLASSIFSMLSLGTVPPIIVRPVPGWG